MIYRPDIDGLRAIAVLAVLFFHAGLGFSGGFVGVDIFFVISGFLITSIIIKDLSAGSFSILHFWERRARRILPALFVVVLFSLICGYFLFFPFDYFRHGSSALMLTSLASNIYFWRNSDGYFTGPVETMPLLHTWSLSLEEQFYVIMPFALLLLFKLGRVKLIIKALAAVASISFFLSVYGAFEYPSDTFYLLHTRAWELVLGSLIAFAPGISSQKIRITMSWVGMIFITIPFFLYSGEIPFPGSAALLPVGGTAFIIWAGIKNNRDHKDCLIHQLLSHKILVWIGLLSYSLYLWHWPLLVFNDYIEMWKNSVSVKIFILMISLFLSWLSYKFIEKPFRTKQLIKSRNSVFIISAAAMITIFSLGLFIRLQDGKVTRTPVIELGQRSPFHDLELRLKVGDKIPDSLPVLGNKKNAPTYLVFGDSHAQPIAPELDRFSNQNGLTGLAFCDSGNPPLVGMHSKFLQKQRRTNKKILFDFLSQGREKNGIERVFLVGRWWLYIHERSLLTKESLNFSQALIETINFLIDNDYEVVVMEQVPQFTDLLMPELKEWYIKFDTHSFSWKAKENYSMSEKELNGRFQKQNEIFTKLKAQFPTVKFLDPLKLFLTENEFKLKDEGGYFYWDDDHLTEYGSSKLRPFFRYLMD